MGKVLIAALMLAAYYAHGRWVFSDMHVQRWVAEHSARAMSGDSKACDDFVDNVEVKLISNDRGGHWEVEGGKDEICGYFKQASAAFTLLQAQTSSQYEDFTIKRGGFPWRDATVTYTERTTIQARAIPTLNASSQDTLVLTRTFDGLKIKKLDSSGGVK